MKGFKAAVAATLLLGATMALAQTPPRVTVKEGVLVGVNDQGAQSFRNIPFAAPPVDAPDLPPFETPDALQTMLANYLSSAPVEHAPAEVAAAPVTIDIAAVPPVADPFDYLVVPDDLNRHELRAEAYV